ncbi:uncharacterized protein BKCO1_1400070 [Diplodia corticola]|uniref:Uncharacterized protein n=1 Tax=Diplodia corticola TaxID=236234 RepID=A0A1J9R5V8_9PEZI|nr:uncharacterized protein BKCO1_1400070 [Diplodia corticola]OJD35937.1 hypothetical protein BKCO1_1400070 [Diplodia corticola]
MGMGEISPSQVNTVSLALSVRSIPPPPPVEHQAIYPTPQDGILSNGVVHLHENVKGEENKEIEGSLRSMHSTRRSHALPFTAQRSTRSPFAAIPADDPRRSAEPHPEESFYAHYYRVLFFTSHPPPFLLTTNTTAMDAQRTTEPTPASAEQQQSRRGPPVRRPSNPPAPRIAPQIPPGGSHPSPAQLQANNFDSSKRTLDSERTKAIWRKVKATAKKWWSRSKQRKMTGAGEAEHDGGIS